MFFLYHHHDLNRLAELQSVLLARRERPHPLVADTIIVPNRGVGRWLQTRLAESEGVAANLDLPLPARFIWRLIPAVLRGDADSSAFERRRMRWHLYALLPELAARDDAVARYLAGEPPEVHRLQLADRLADLFDQYLIHRPGLLYDWEAGRIADTPVDRWQAAAWRALVARLGHDHRARLLHRFVATLEGSGDFDRTALPDTVYCFGLDVLPPEYVRFLYALSRHAAVHFLLPNPCESYWGEIVREPVALAAPRPEEPGADERTIEDGHPLLASLGRGIRDLLRVLYADEMQAIQEPELGPALAYEPPTGERLLQRVQAGIVDMTAPRESRGLAGDDVSVQVHACHGPLREVQVLQDQLLDLLGRDPDLAPRDIVVMLPDVAAYAPAVRAVFGAAAEDRYLPYSLSDGSRGASHPIMRSFQQVLDLPISRWPASEILALAAVPAVMHRFGLDEAALANAREWIREAGVRWGFDARTRAAFGADDGNRNTWRFGLDRLLLGVVQSDPEALVAGVAPWSDLEGGATAALGGLWHLLERLRAWADRMDEPASAAAWQDRLNALIDDLFQVDPGDAGERGAIEELRNGIAMLGDAASCLGAEPLSWRTVRETLTDELAASGERQPFLTGGITFCSPMPLRGVPFRVVCLLGMNDGDFPPAERNRSINLLRARPRLGDRDPRDDGRLLFLQAIMAARDVFYVSYTGQDIASGDTLPPSPLVGEWLDFLHRHYFDGLSTTEFEAKLVTRQPMHPFSERLFQPGGQGSRLFTFAREWEGASRAGRQERIEAPSLIDGTTAPAPDAGTIELAELRRFFDHPPRYFLRECLRLNLEPPDAEIEDQEPLALDGLDAWRLRDRLYRDAVRRDLRQVATAPDALWRARGSLPPPPLDAAPFAAQAERINALLPIHHGWAREAPTPDRVDIDIAVGPYRLVGRTGDVWPDGPRRMRPGSLRMQHRLRGWIDYLAYRAAGFEGSLRLAGLDDDTAVEYRAEIDSAQALDHLAELLDLFVAGQRAPLPFLPDLADAFLRARDRDRNGDAAAALRRINGRLGNRFQPPPEALDPYFAPLLADDPPLGADPDESRFVALAERICTPPHRYLLPLDPAGGEA